MSKVIRKVIRARKKKNTGKVSKRKKEERAPKSLSKSSSKRGSSQQAKPTKQKSKKSSSGKKKSKPKDKWHFLRKNQFSSTNQPKGKVGRPKGAVSLTALLRKAIMMEIPVDVPQRRAKQKKLVAQILIDTAVEHAARGRYGYFKELWDRLEGKVPDHIIQETTKKLIKTETEQIALELLDLVSKTADKYMTEKLADKFLKELSEALMKRYAEPPEKEDQDGKR